MNRTLTQLQLDVVTKVPEEVLWDRLEKGQGIADLVRNMASEQYIKHEKLKKVIPYLESIMQQRKNGRSAVKEEMQLLEHLKTANINLKRSIYNFPEKYRAVIRHVSPNMSSLRKKYLPTRSNNTRDTALIVFRRLLDERYTNAQVPAMKRLVNEQLANEFNMIEP